MRTTLDIDAELLEAAKELAVLEKTTTGKVLSRLARRGLNPEPSEQHPIRNGIEMLPPRGEMVSTNHVQSIMDKENI